MLLFLLVLLFLIWLASKKEIGTYAAFAGIKTS